MREEETKSVKMLAVMGGWGDNVRVWYLRGYF